MNKIILLGYMGSGKSIVGGILAAKINLPHIDLDQFIESQTNSSIKVLFEKKGEVFFRKIEHQILGEIIDSDAKIVLSLGGGTPCYSNNHQILNKSGVVSFYLKASVATLTRRLTEGKNERPLISTLEGADLHEFIAKHLFERNYYYNLANHTIAVDGKSAEEIVLEIQDFLI